MNGFSRQPNHAMRLLPFLAWLPLLTRGVIRGDLVAGLTGIYQHLDKSVCALCDRRIFRECAPAPD